MNILKATALFAKETSTMARCFLPKAMLFAIALAPLAESATDTPPNRMTVQSYITDDSGTPIGSAGTVNKKMTFFIYTADTGGDPKFADVQIVSIDDGHFSVVLGEGDEVSGQSHDLSVAFSGEDASDRFLEIQVSDTDGSNAQTLSPRLRLLPSAYSFLASYANEAAKVTGGGVSTDAIADSAVTSAKVAPDSLTAADLAAGSVGSSEVTDNSLTAADLAPNSVGNSELSSDLQLSGRVGVNIRWSSVTLGLKSLATSDYLIYGVGSDGGVDFYVNSAGTIWSSGGLGSNMVNSAAVTDNSLTASDLAANSVGSSEVANNSLTAADLAANSVGSSELAANPNFTDGVGINHYAYNNVVLSLKALSGDDYMIYGENSAGTRVFHIGTNGVYTGASDRSLKDDIEPLRTVLPSVLEMKPVTYRFKTDPIDSVQIGFIAQDIEELFPEAVSENDGILGLSYQQFGVIAIGAVQELNEKVVDLETENAELKERLDALEAIVNSLVQ